MMMQPFDEYKITGLDFKLRKLGNLLYHEGPIETHYVNENDEDYLLLWVDGDDEFNRWLLFKTTIPLLDDFFQKELTTLDLIHKNPDGFIYLIDIDDNLVHRRFYKLPVKKIPGDYLPSRASFFEELQFEDYALQLKNYLSLHLLRHGKAYPNQARSSVSLAAEPDGPGFEKPA
jgi:hypothetical protein